jgi:phosphate starvation-inducible PhoH-like protein
MQMKMFLTRIGFNSKMIVTGDVTQIDLPHKNMSGLIEALHILRNLNGLSIVEFNNSDVMRHPLVFKIVNRYNKLQEEKNENKSF